MADSVVETGGWEIWHDWHVRTMKASADWFCNAIAAAPGMVVLDVACGTGIPSLAIAERVAPNGEVVAVDASPAMLGAARRKAEAAGIRNIRHREMDGGALDFPDASFDAVTCKDGVMFCSDPVHALAEIRRVLKPGGRFAISVWDELEKCHFFNTMFGPVSKALGRQPPDPSAPGPFRLALPGAFERALLDAGLTDAAVEPREVVFEFDSLDQHWSATSAMAAPVEAAKATLPPDELAALKRAIADGLAPFMSGERIRVPNLARCATGTR